MDSIKGQHGRGRPGNSTHTRTLSFFSLETVKSFDHFWKIRKEDHTDQGLLVKILSAYDGLANQKRKKPFVRFFIASRQIP